MQSLIGKDLCDLHLFSQHLFAVGEMRTCVFPKTRHFFKVLSHRLHWTVHLLLVLWSFKLHALLNLAGQFSHLNSFLSPPHIILWLLLLLYGITLSQFLQDTTLWIFLCILSFIAPLHVTSHSSHFNTRSSCFDLMCCLKCFSDGASVPHTAQDGMLTGLDWNFFSTGNSSGCH